MGFSISRAIGAVGAGLGGYVDGKREEEEYQHAKRKRDEEAAGMDMVAEYRKEIGKYVMETTSGAENMAAASLPAGVEVKDSPATPATPATPGSDTPATPDTLEGQAMPKAIEISDIYKKYSIMAMTNPYAAERLKPALDQLKMLGMSRQAKEFSGDISTAKGALDYSRHMAEAAGTYGNAMTGEQAIRYAAESKRIKDTGITDALQYAHEGNLGKATEKYGENGTIVAIEPGVYSIGGQEIKTNIVTVKDKEGNVTKINAGQALFRQQATDAQIKQVLQGKENTDKQTSRMATRNVASAGVGHKANTLAETIRHNKATEKISRKAKVAAKGGITPALIKKTERDYFKALSDAQAKDLTIRAGTPLYKTTKQLEDAARGMTRRLFELEDKGEDEKPAPKTKPNNYSADDIFSKALGNN